MKTNIKSAFKRIKSYTLIVAFSVSMLCAIPGYSNNEIKSNLIEQTQSSAKNTESKRIANRIEEIRSMDLSKLSPPQRKTLRNELLSMKKKFQANDGGIYISAGAIIIILLLIIILF